MFATLVSPSLVAHAAAAPANQAVTTFKYDNGHTGQDANETLLTTNNVASATFGKKMSYPVDGQVYAQPLYLPGLTINGSVHNVVFVTTEHDSVYAFDADATSASAPLWQTSFLSSGVTTVPSSAVSCNDTQPEIGITGTPVIDSSTNTMYVVVYTYENNAPVYRLHALDVTTGQDKAPAIVLQSSLAGTGSGAVNGTITFNPLKERQRAGLILANGQIYIAFASFCDDGPYHGWVFGYTYSNSQFQQSAVYNDSLDGSGGGYWGSGGAISVDSSGNLYLLSGNGTFDYNTGGNSLGNAFVKLNAQLQVQDYFAPFNQYCLNLADTDLGSGSALILPGLNELVSGGKEGRFYVLNTNDLGKYTVDANLGTNCTSSEHLRTDVDRVLQEFAPGTVGGIYQAPSYWNGSSGQYVYIGGSGTVTKAFQVQSNGLLSTSATSQTPESFGFTGGDPIISSNGTSNGILWLIDPGAILRAYDATNLSKELYNSNQIASRDALGTYVKFGVPTVANGEVFVGTTNALVIYGLNPPAAPTPTPGGTSTPTTGVPYTNIGISNDSAPTSANFDWAGNSYSYQTLLNAGLNPGDNAFFNNMVFTWPNVVAGQPDNYVPSGQTLLVNPISGANVLGFLGAATGGSGSGTTTINYTDGSTQSFTLGFTDWTFGGSTPAFGNQIMATLPYRNTPSGTQTKKTYIFYAEANMLPGKVVKSVTLPAKSTGGAMHIFTAATKKVVIVPTPAFNNVGTSDDSNPSAGNFDGANSYSAEALQQVGITPGGTVTSNGFTFTWPSAAAGQPNNYTANGQVLPAQVKGATTLAILGSASGGNASGTATITYASGATQTFTLGFSDWTLGGGGGSPAFGNLVVATAPYRNTPNGSQTTDKPVIFFAQVALLTSENIQSLTLPTITQGGQLHVFAITTDQGSGVSGPTPAPLNNIGISDDSNPATGNFDGANSYSAEALQAVGITAGSNVIFNGVSFTWPSATPGTLDNYQAKGQLVAVAPVSGATTLAFLGSASGGASSGTTTITYTDGTTQTFTLGFSDWTLGGGGGSPAFGNQIVATCAYRNTPTGPQTDKPIIFYAAVSITIGKTVQSVTLPTTTGGQLHVFSVATK
jgi:hypothetical protein